MREFNTRTTKGGYFITFETDDRKAFEQVQTLCRILIDGKDGDAIPIEWIKEWYKKHVIYLDENKPTGKGLYAYEQMIYDWEKENEHKESD